MTHLVYLALSDGFTITLFMVANNLYCSELRCLSLTALFHLRLIFQGKAWAYPSGAPTDRLLAIVANIRLRLKLLSETNTQDYYGTELIAALIFSCYSLLQIVLDRSVFCLCQGFKANI